MLSPLLLSVLVAGAVPADLPVAGDGMRLVIQAQRDFEERHEELGLIGSAPLYGLEPILPAEVAQPKAAVRTVRAPVGAAPLYGLEALAPLPAAPAAGR